jgi:3-isopropylmalate/(R)-2-methylmalate dehydratase small subunit
MPEPFTIVTGRAAPLMETNINTDVIIRIERLTSGDQSKLGAFALEAMRYRPDGSDNPEFPLNQPKYRGAPILIAGRNFGCGSSREGAVTALMGMGLRCVIAESFGDIFYGNCFQNGMLPIRLPDAVVQSLVKESEASDAPFSINLEQGTVTTPAGNSIAFTVDTLRRQGLLSGLDEIGQTLREDEAIKAWQAQDHADRPWVWQATG